jgi:hypothetical protein
MSGSGRNIRNGRGGRVLYSRTAQRFNPASTVRSGQRSAPCRVSLSASGPGPAAPITRAARHVRRATRRNLTQKQWAGQPASAWQCHHCREPRTAVTLPARRPDGPAILRMSVKMTTCSIASANSARKVYTPRCGRMTCCRSNYDELTPAASRRYANKPGPCGQGGHERVRHANGAGLLRTSGREEICRAD